MRQCVVSSPRYALAFAALCWKGLQRRQNQDSTSILSIHFPKLCLTEPRYSAVFKGFGCPKLLAPARSCAICPPLIKDMLTRSCSNILFCFQIIELQNLQILHFQSIPRTSLTTSHPKFCAHIPDLHSHLKAERLGRVVTLQLWVLASQGDLYLRRMTYKISNSSSFD